MRKLAAFTWCASLAGCHVPSTGPTDITVTTSSPPAFVAFHDESTDWQTVAPAGDPFVVTVRGAYQIVVVCDFGPIDGVSDVLTWRVARTPADDLSFDAYCGSSPIGYDVTGTMVQAGVLGFGDMYERSKTANWTFDLTQPDGAYDLVAMSADHALIRRGVAVSGAALTLPPVDVVADGLPLAVTPLTVTNPSGDEALTAHVRFETATTGVVSPFNVSLDALGVVPDSAMIATDSQRITVRSDSPGELYGRTTSHTMPLATTAFTLPAELPAIRFAASDTALTASWSTQPGYETFELSIDQFTSSKDVVDIAEISASYLAQTGDTAVTIDSSIPGFMEPWRMDPQQAYNRALDGYTTRPDGADAAYLSEDVPGTLRARSDRARPAGSGRARSRRTGS